MIGESHLFVSQHKWKLLRDLSGYIFKDFNIVPLLLCKSNVTCHCIPKPSRCFYRTSLASCNIEKCAF